MVRRVVLALAVLLGLSLIPAVTASAAQARTAAHVFRAYQNGNNHTLWVRGFAYDTKHPTRSVTVRVYADGHYVGKAVANRNSPKFDRKHHLHGKHKFSVGLHMRRMADTVAIRGLHSRHVAAQHVVYSYWPNSGNNPGARVVAIARQFVGKVPYVFAAASPSRGFDCSGLVMYAYKHAHIANLSHYAPTQRTAKGMHRISRSDARPGDLIFYLSGSYAYHVAIYAGHGMEISAADEQEGIVYQHVWGHHYEYRTDWHK